MRVPFSYLDRQFASIDGILDDIRRFVATWDGYYEFAFRKDGERIVGKAAKNQAITNPENTIFSIKRFMGRKHSEV